MSAPHPWIKFYPRDWRGDQALRVVSLPARGLWIEMLCIMHEANPYGHLLVGGEPVSGAVLARLVGSTVEEVQALLVELRAAGVFRQTRGGVIYSKRLTDDHKKHLAGKVAKEEALVKSGKKPGPSRGATRGPSSQKPEARGRIEGINPSIPSDSEENIFKGPKEVRTAFVAKLGEEWCRTYLDRCAWQDIPERALIPATQTAGLRIVREARALLRELGLAVLEKAA
jgi:hypothetical protein